jgi:hypothetical protein
MIIYIYPLPWHQLSELQQHKLEWKHVADTTNITSTSAPVVPSTPQLDNLCAEVQLEQRRSCAKQNKTVLGLLLHHCISCTLPNAP